MPRKNKILRRSRLMGIVNVTPDSFSDGGDYFRPEQAIEHALEMLAGGAEIIDIGGESTRPGADNLPVDDEIARVVPVIAGLKKVKPDCIISIDTRKSVVAAAALEAGADIVNDVSGLQYSPDMAELAARYDAKLVLMHMRGTPENMQSTENLCYADVVTETVAFLTEAADKAIASGVKRENIIIDPGIGFSKTVEQCFELMTGIDRFLETGYEVLVGPSRKSFIGKTLSIPDPKERMWGTAGAVAYLALRGIDIIRVHDVKEMRQMLDIYERCLDAE
jgi:dihydropteroate synthase